MFQGAFTAVVTPFRQDGSLDEKALRNLIKFQIEKGINGLVPCGTTGESPTLSSEEWETVIAIAVEEANGKVPVIAGTGTNSTDKTVKATKRAKELGADGALIVNPYYNKPTQDGLYQHFRTVAGKVDIPIVLYNIKGRTAVNVETETLMKLTNECSNIVAVKEASGDISQMMDVIAQKPDHVNVLSGDDGLTLPLLAVGGKGVISVASNIHPARVTEMVTKALNNQLGPALRIHYELLPLFKGIFIETNPVPIKAALAMKGMIQEAYRLPLTPMRPSNKEKLRKILEAMKLIYSN